MSHVHGHGSPTHTFPHSIPLENGNQHIGDGVILGLRFLGDYFRQQNGTRIGVVLDPIVEIETKQLWECHNLSGAKKASLRSPNIHSTYSFDKKK